MAWLATMMHLCDNFNYYTVIELPHDAYNKTHNTIVGIRQDAHIGSCYNLLTCGHLYTSGIGPDVDGGIEADKFSIL
jgi:hypothetical protein